MNISIYKRIFFKDSTIIIIFLSLLCGFIKKTLYILVIVLLHEFGHVLVCLFLKYEIIKIEIYPFGGITKTNKLLNDSFFHDVLLASGGIIIQIIIALLGKVGIITNDLFLDLNYKILVFNLLPIIPLDGSKIVFELINKITSYHQSLRYYLIISLLGIIVFVYYNIYQIIDVLIIILLFIEKTINVYKNKEIIFNKFILERKLYHLKFNRIKQYNQLLINYQKDVKYLYNINNKLIDEYDYLNNIY